VQGVRRFMVAGRGLLHHLTPGKLAQVGNLPAVLFQHR